MRRAKASAPPHSEAALPRPATQVHIAEIDALRAVAILLVLLWRYSGMPAAMAVGADGAGIGQVCTLLFFAVSGFTVHLALSRSAHLGDYVIARCARLFPAYWTAIAVTLCIGAISTVGASRGSARDILVNLTMLQGFAGVSSIDPAYATLTVLLCFYAAMAVLWRARLVAHIETVLAGWLALALLHARWPGFPPPIAEILILGHIHLFAIGLIAGRVHAGHRSWRQQVPILAALTVQIAATDGLHGLAAPFLVTLSFVALTKGWLRWLRAGPLLWLGTISYPLYLVHGIAGAAAMHAATLVGIGRTASIACAIAAAVAVAAAIHHGVERRAGPWIMTLWRRGGAADHDAALEPLPAMVRPRLIELDALRGIGAVMVMNFHYSTRFAEMFPAAHHVPFHIFDGNYRVMLFFAISGFAIFFTLRNLQRASDFLVGRAVRLLPAYWGAIALILTAEYLGHVPELLIPVPALLVNLTMLQGYFYVPAVDGAYWTLAFEIGFYACTLLLWAVGGLRRIEPVLLGWLSLKWAMFYWPGMPTRLAELLVLQWVPFFAVGMLAYRVWSGERRWRDQLPYVFVLLVTVARTNPPEHLPAIMIIAAAFAAMVEGKLAWISWRPLLWLGSISYSLYLVHENIGFVIMLTGDRLRYSPWASYTVACLFAVVLGAALHRYVERPAADALLRRWKRRRGMARAVTRPLTDERPV